MIGPGSDKNTGPHNLQSFLTANSTRTIFLYRVCSVFCDIRDKSAVFNILQQNVMHLQNNDIRNLTRYYKIASPRCVSLYVKEDVFFLESYQNDLYIFLETWISISQRVEEPQIL